VCESLKKYLRNRDDTVKCIVSNLIDDGESSNDLMEEFCKDLGVYENSCDIIDSTTAMPLPPPPPPNDPKPKSWQLWNPDPIDAINSSNANDNTTIGSKSNIITMLVNIYGSKDM
jgi:anaphase-promoting complex subunit 2